jgi:hypothetical protein
MQVLRLLIILCLVQCSGLAQAQQPASAQDRIILANLATWSVTPPASDDYAIKTQRCVASTLEFNANAHILAASKPDNATMRAGLLGGPANEPQTALLRQKQFELWRSSQSVGKMSYLQFATCLESVPIVVEEVVVNCFDLGLIPALAEFEKGRGASVNWTVETLQQMTQGNVPLAFLRRAVEAVFAQNAKATQFQAHRETFSECLRSAL